MDTERHEELSLTKIGKVVRKLRLSNNSVVLLKAGSALAQTDNIEKLSNAIAEAGLLGVIVAIVEEFDDLAVLNEDEMKELGWFKFDTASAAIMNRLLKEKLDGKDDGVQSV